MWREVALIGFIALLDGAQSVGSKAKSAVLREGMLERMDRLTAIWLKAIQ